MVEPPPAARKGAVGDLIELSDAFDLGEEAAGTTDGAGGGVGATGDGIEQRLPALGTGSARDEQESMLRERFPPRGRPFLASGIPRRTKGD